MDGFKNTTKMKYMCGGPVRKATGGAIKSVAPKGVMKSAASAKQLPTPEIAPKRQVQPTPPKDVRTIGGAPKAPKATPPEPIREAPRPTMEPKRLIAQTPPEDKGRELPRPTMGPKRQVQPTPPKDVRTIGGAPKAPKDVAGPAWMDFAKTIGGEPKAPKDVGRELPRPEMAPKGAKTMGGVPKGVKTGAAAAQTMGGASRDAKTIGSVNPGAKTLGGTPRGMGNAPAQATAAPRGPGSGPAKAISSVSTAKKGIPVASKKPMIGFKTGGHVTKSSFKW